MTDLFGFKLDNQGLSVEYSVVSLVDFDYQVQGGTIEKNILDIDGRIQCVQDSVDRCNLEIERLTNHSDVFDNLLAVSSGLLCGLIDSFYVGEFDFKQLMADSHKNVNKFIEAFAIANGYDGNGRLEGAIAFLENKFPVAQDNIWKSYGVSSARLHHLEDIAHHPTPAGLIAAIFVTFFRVGAFVSKEGKWKVISVDTNPEQLLKIWLPIIISGILFWVINLAESRNLKSFNSLPKPVKKLIKALSASPALLQVLKETHNWCGHIVSDMGGSKNTPGGGMGIPGLFLSLLKELASIPPLNKTNLSKVVSDLYSKNKVDMRAELAIVKYLGKQAVPVLLNETIVRTLYFVRRLIDEKRQGQSWDNVNWSSVVPLNNRTIERMITISSGTFMAVDMADAAIRSGVKSHGSSVSFATNFVLRVNFVGVGRFAVAVWNDAKMGRENAVKECERQKLYEELLGLNNAKMFYRNADMWLSAESAAETVQETTAIAQQAISYYVDTWNSIFSSIESVSNNVHNIEKRNPGLLDSLVKILE